MFRCFTCGRLTPPRTPQIRVVIATRVKKYPVRSKANVFWRLDERGKRKKKVVDDPGGNGVEIVSEIRVCPACADESQP